MKIKFDCPSCLINRAHIESEKASTDPDVRLKALLEALKEIGCHTNPNVSPAYLGTIRDRAIKKASKNPDPFSKDKLESNERAIKLLPKVRDYVSNAQDTSQRFRRACLASIVGNAFEFGIKGYNFDYDNLPRWIEDAQRDIAIDDITKIESIIATIKKVLLLTDNAGEIAFDKILVEQLKEMGLEVTVAVKAAPISNDATLEDAKMVSMTTSANKVITTGTDSVGLLIEECSKEFLEIYNDSELVFAKGMAHYETLSDHKVTQPHAFMFRVKCPAISNELGIELGKNIAYLIEPSYSN